MRHWLAAVLLSTAAGTAAADDAASGLTFSGRPVPTRIEMRAASAGDRTVWDSGAGDPVSEDFSAVALQGMIPEGDWIFEAAVRTGAGWGPFVSARPERYPNGRFWVRIPLSGKSGSVLRLRLVGAASGPGGSLEIFQAVLTAVGGESAASGAAGDAPVLSGDGAVLEGVELRSAWGARPASASYEPMLPLRLTLHHTEMAQPMTRSDAVTELQVIQDFHIQGRGWIDIGYHFLIDGAGRVWEGRPHSVIGAHVRNKNDGNVGIALLGNFHPPSAHRPTAAQIKAFVALARRLTAAYSMEPRQILGHRDQQGTSCPGDALYSRLPFLRKAVAAPAPAAAPSLRPVMKLLQESGIETIFEGGR